MPGRLPPFDCEHDLRASVDLSVSNLHLVTNVALKAQTAGFGA